MLIFLMLKKNLLKKNLKNKILYLIYLKNIIIIKKNKNLDIL